MELALSIDIGGTNTKLALVNRKGELIALNRMSTSGTSGTQPYFRKLFQAISQLFANRDTAFQLIGIGIGAPGSNGPKGTIEYAANLPFSGKVEICRILENEYNVPAFLIKDANAAALGEKCFGGGRGMQNIITLTLGTGLGCGIILNNQVVSGTDGLAGEFGHTIAIKDGRLCNCGRKGCLETYASATGLKRTVLHLLAQTKEKSTLARYTSDKLEAKTIFDMAKAGDSLAKTAFEYTGKLLGSKMAELATVLCPEAFFLSGGVIAAGDFILEPTIHHFNANLLPIMQGKINILPSSLGADNAALLGAASMVWEKAKIVQI
ncbi:MAG: glucokinase [Saprospiraceae bacterium]|nr:MAG: glucokinase [Saprospiraceae bacterium]